SGARWPARRRRNPSTRCGWAPTAPAADGARLPRDRACGACAPPGQRCGTAGRFACGWRSSPPVPAGCAAVGSRTGDVRPPTQRAWPATTRSPCAAGSATRCVTSPVPGGPAAPTGPASPARPRRQPVASAGSVFSPRHDPQRFVVQHRLGQQLLEPRVLHFQRLQALGVGHVHAAELAPPQVERRVTETVLAAQLLDRRAGGRLLQEADDLFFGVSLLHVRPLVRRTLLRSDWPGYRGAGQGSEGLALQVPALTNPAAAIELGHRKHLLCQVHTHGYSAHWRLPLRLIVRRNTIMALDAERLV